MLNSLVEFHNQIFDSLHVLTTISPELNFWIYIIAEQLDWYVLLAGMLFIILHRHGHSINRPVFISRVSIIEGIYTTAGILIAWGISYIMKISFAIGRPFIQLMDVLPLFPYGGYDSFPSGHATLFAAMAVAIYLHHRKVGSIFILAAFLIGITRVIAGVHFPIDVLVGWILGGLSSWLVYKYFTKKMK